MSWDLSLLGQNPEGQAKAISRYFTKIRGRVLAVCQSRPDTMKSLWNVESELLQTSSSRAVYRNNRGVEYLRPFTKQALEHQLSGLTVLVF